MSNYIKKFDSFINESLNLRTNGINYDYTCQAIKDIPELGNDDFETLPKEYKMTRLSYEAADFIEYKQSSTYQEWLNEYKELIRNKFSSIDELSDDDLRTCYIMANKSLKDKYKHNGKLIIEPENFDKYINENLNLNEIPEIDFTYFSKILSRYENNKETTRIILYDKNMLAGMGLERLGTVIDSTTCLDDLNQEPLNNLYICKEFNRLDLDVLKKVISLNNNYNILALIDPNDNFTGIMDNPGLTDRFEIYQLDHSVNWRTKTELWRKNILPKE